MADTQHHSELNPYNRATYLSELIQAANRLLDDVAPHALEGKGICALMDVIAERADDLARELDRDEFSDGWPKLCEQLERAA